MKNRRAIVGAFAVSVLGAATLFARTAGATNTVDFCSFSDTSQVNALVQSNGDAVVSGAQIHLTPNLTNKSGSAYLKQAFSWNANTSFATHFRFKLYPNTGGEDGGVQGGDGITFVVQNKSVTAVGGSGQGLGYNGVGNSAAVIFDTHKDSGDPSDNFIGVMTGGNSLVTTAASPVLLRSGVEIDAWVDYDGPTDALKVYVANAPSAKPASPTLSTTVDIEAQVGAQAFLGFTGSTGTPEKNNQDIDYWVYNTDGTPLLDCTPCVNDSQCLNPASPACQPDGTCGQCSATNQSQCTGSTPVCIIPIGECGGCASDADCSGNTPVCNTTTHLCGPCTSDNDCKNPADPVCQLTGPLAGSCTECSGTEIGKCGGPVPVCIPDLGVCGCNTSTDCGPNQLCEGEPPTCVPGCSLADGGKDCTTPGVCSVQDGGLGVCLGNDCDGGTGQCNAPTPVCGISGGVCVQCNDTTDCTGGLVCDPSNNTCVECVPGDAGANNCTATGPGAICLPNDTCGCETDSDCGGPNSGRVCQDTAHVCIAGCRGTGGNMCPIDQQCSSTDSTIGTCGPLTEDGGINDAGLDGSISDSGLDGSTRDGSAGDGSVADGSFFDGSKGDGSSDNGIDGSSVEGGGCGCVIAGGEDSSAPVGMLLSFGALGLAILRPKRKKR